MTILSYHVLNGINGKWLGADERSWTSSFTDSASFDNAKLAQDIGERQLGLTTSVIYVMGIIGE